MWKFHANLPATRTWGYWSDSGRARLPGPTIEATRRPSDTVATELTVKWVNELDKAFLPNDPTIMGAVLPGEPAPIVTHLHGGENQPQFDGTPLQWFTEAGDKGPHYITNTYTYDNEQRARMSGTTTTRSATRARTSTRGCRGLLHPRRPGHGRARQSARPAGRPV